MIGMVIDHNEDPLIFNLPEAVSAVIATSPKNSPKPEARLGADVTI